MGFRLVTVNEGETPPLRGARPAGQVDARATELADRVKGWAAGDSIRWKKLHKALLRKYSPQWDVIDARDVVVAWVAAWMALTDAEREIERLNHLRGRVNQREALARDARNADVRFWARVVDQLDSRVLRAFSRDTEALKLVEAFVSRSARRAS